MGLILHTRVLLGVSQQALSEYLSVKRSQVNMAERDERHLPNEKFAQVMELNQYLEIAKPPEALPWVQTYQQTERQELQNYIQERIVLLRHQQKQWQEKFEKQQKAYKKHLRAYHAFAQANAQSGDKPEHQQSWLRLYYRLIREKLEKNGQKALMELEIKLKMIASELTVLEEYHHKK